MDIEEDKLDRDFWKKEEEKLLKDWSDRAQCFYLMHLKSHRKYRYRNALFIIPSIVLSTVCGTANFAQNLFGDYQTIATVIIGGMSITSGIITTVHQFLKVSELNEQHRLASIAWGKFYEYIKTELTKNPLDRERPSKVLKYCSQHYDILTESSPIIGEDIVNEFKKQVKMEGDIEVPIICGNVKETDIFSDTVFDLRSPSNMNITKESSF